MSYLHIGKNVMVSRRRIIGVFDLDITSQSPRTREFLDRAERDGVVLDACDDIPKSFLVCDHPSPKASGLYLPAKHTDPSKAQGKRPPGRPRRARKGKNPCLNWKK